MAGGKMPGVRELGGKQGWGNANAWDDRLQRSRSSWNCILRKSQITWSWNGEAGSQNLGRTNPWNCRGLFLHVYSPEGEGEGEVRTILALNSLMVISSFKNCLESDQAGRISWSLQNVSFTWLFTVFSIQYGPGIETSLFFAMLNWWL